MEHPHAGCLLCGGALRYSPQAETRTCALCGGGFSSAAACEQGHFVCDACHASALPAVLAHLRAGGGRDPLALFDEAVALDGVHLHGPEHHTIVPAVLLTAYRNNGGALDLSAALAEAARRGQSVPGGICGGWGVCGAAAGAGIFASILTGSSPLNGPAWGAPMALSARCLERIGRVGGPRCCKRTARLAIETAAAFSREELGVEMPAAPGPCAFARQNAECIGGRCPYFAPPRG